jgi:signal peptidase I
VGKTKGRKKTSQANWTGRNSSRGVFGGIKNMNFKKYFQKHSVLREWVESIAIAFVIAMVIRAFAFQAFKIPTGSMRTTLLEGDRLLVNKLVYGPQIPFTDWRIPGYGKLTRGDVIVFKFPEDPKRDFIKRLIAFPGETVTIDEGGIYINGKKIEDRKILNQYYYNRGDYGAKGQIIRVPKNFYFVLGDNSASSMDSRFWGFVPESYLVGKAEVIYWPITRIRMIK